MENNDLLHVNLKIFEQGILGITIQRNEEEKYRQAASDVSELIKIYRNRFPKQPLANILAMTAVNLALRSLTAEGSKGERALLEQIQALNADLGQCLEAISE